MRFRRLVTLAAVLGISAAGLGLWASPATAGCAAPTIQVDGGAAEVPQGASVSVSGEWFHEGCDDTTASGPGCSGPPPAPTETPMRGVVLELHQGGAAWTLGTADATGLDRHYSISWRVRLPVGAKAGPALLTAGSARATITITS